VLVVMLVMVQSPKNPVVTVRTQRRSSKCCQREKRTSEKQNELPKLKPCKKKHTHTRGRRHAPLSTNGDKVVVLLTLETLPVVSTDKNVVVFPFSVGRWGPYYQLQTPLPHVQRPEARGSRYLARFITKQQLVYGKVVLPIA
jgi:hypothetical protein